MWQIWNIWNTKDFSVYVTLIHFNRSRHTQRLCQILPRKRQQIILLSVTYLGMYRENYLFRTVLVIIQRTGVLLWPVFLKAFSVRNTSQTVFCAKLDRAMKPLKTLLPTIPLRYVKPYRIIYADCQCRQVHFIVGEEKMHLTCIFSMANAKYSNVLFLWVFLAWLYRSEDCMPSSYHCDVSMNFQQCQFTTV